MRLSGLYGCGDLVRIARKRKKMRTVVILASALASIISGNNVDEL